MLVRVRRFGVLRTATVAAAVYFVIALFFALFFVIVALASPTTVVPGSALGPGAPAISFDARPMLIVFAIIIPIFYGVIGWVFTAIACLLYNLVSRFIGGVEMEITPLAQPGSVAQPGVPGGPGGTAG